MKISELINALAELQEKHGDLPVFFDEFLIEYGCSLPVMIDKAEYVKTPSIESILLQDKWSNPELGATGPTLQFEGKGSGKLISFDENGFTINHPKTT